MYKNVNELPFWIYAEYVTKDGTKKEAHIQTKSFGKSKQDCQIGDFSENWYIRPNKAVKYQDYKSVGSYKTAIRLAMQKILGCKVLSIYEKINVDGVEHIKTI